MCAVEVPTPSAGPDGVTSVTRAPHAPRAMSWPARAAAAPNRPGPGGVAVRLALLAGIALVVASVHIPRPATLCPLLAMTGIPCPFCGSTSAAVQIGRGDPAAALAANPVTTLVAVGWVLGPLGLSRWWWGLPGARRVTALVALLAVAWVWQLARTFG